MAEFALGLTKTAVEGTLSRVKSAIDEETKHKERVQNDLVFITGEFEMMQSFLKGANAAECAKNEVVRTWVRQIRDLAFDVEDCVEFVVHLDKTSPWTSWFWRVVPSCIAPVLPLDMAVSDIKQLKARVVDVSDRNTRYNLISSNSDSNTNWKPAVVIPSPATELMPATSSLTFHMLSEVWEAEGKHRGTGDLRKLITSQGSDLQVISVWGISTEAAAFHHLGGTSIIRKAYDDPVVCQEFSSRAWIKLMHPFNPRKFLKSLLTQLQARCYQANKDSGQVDHFRTRMEAALATEDDLNAKVELMQQLRDQRYLIVLEELSTMVEWDIIRTYLPDSEKGSRIVVSTQRLGIALSCTGKPYQVADLGRFSHGQSVCAFFNQGCQFYGYGGREASILFSNRMEETTKWPKTLLVGDQCRAAGHLEEAIDDTDAGVVSIWGIAGVGKSFVAKTVYYNQMFTSNRGPMHGYRSFSWVDMPYPFNLAEFSRLLFLDFHSDDLQAKEAAAIDMMEGQDPIEGCGKFLRECRCLIVIDGLRSTHDWNLIKDTFLSEPTQGCILVITNEASVARYCARVLSQVINVKALEPDVALPLLRKIASGDECRTLNPEEMEVSELIIAKCGGLPQVIVAVGEYFAEQGYPVEYLSDHFIGSLEEIPAFHSLRGLFSRMQSYFDACSDSLKPCIFYLSVFPIDHNIRRRRLLRRWVAESYSRDKYGRTSQLYGENLFAELVKLSIIQQSRSSRSGSSKVDVCQVNGFFHEYIMSRPMEDNLVFALEWHDGMNVQPAGGQHLTVRSNWERDEIEFQSLDLSRLRSLTVFGEWRSFFISSNMGLLRVLDLEDTSGVRDDDLNQIGKLVPRLKFLSLRGCKDVTCLPDSLGDLRQLQTLDVRHTQITTLPHAIIKLVKLQHVRAGTTLGPPEVDGGDRYTVVPPLIVAAEDDVNENSDGDKCQSSVAGLQLVPMVEGNGTAQVVSEVDEFCTSPWMRRRARKLVASCSWMSTKSTSRVRQLGVGNRVGVKVPGSGMGKLIALHTLGVVNVTCSGKAILEELKKLTQLRKLGVSGINMGNIQELFRAISDHPHLRSLSVGADKEDGFTCSDDTISLQPPKTLQRLKLHGDVTVLPVWRLWTKQFPKPRKVDLEVTVSTQEDIDVFDDFPPRCGLRRLYVKPIQDGELHFGNLEEATCIWRVLNLKVLKIDCSSSRKSQVTFYKLYPIVVEVLKIHCSSGSVLRVSGIQHLEKLKEVLLKGSYDDQLKQDLLKELSKHKNKPVLKVVVQPSSS